MKTWIVFFYLGTVVGVAGPVDVGVAECRALVEDRDWLLGEIAKTGFSSDEIAIGCFRMERPPRVGAVT